MTGYQIPISPFLLSIPTSAPRFSLEDCFGQHLEAGCWMGFILAKALCSSEYTRGIDASPQCVEETGLWVGVGRMEKQKGTLHNNLHKWEPFHSSCIMCMSYVVNLSCFSIFFHHIQYHTKVKISSNSSIISYFSFVFLKPDLFEGCEALSTCSFKEKQYFTTSIKKKQLSTSYRISLLLP